MHTLSIQLPDDVFTTLHKDPEKLAQEMRIAAVVKWYELGEVSQGKAAEIAGLTRSGFIDALVRYKVSPFQCTGEELTEELESFGNSKACVDFLESIQLKTERNRKSSALIKLSRKDQLCLLMSLIRQYRRYRKSKYRKFKHKSKRPGEAFLEERQVLVDYLSLFSTEALKCYLIEDLYFVIDIQVPIPLLSQIYSLLSLLFKFDKTLEKILIEQAILIKEVQNQSSRSAANTRQVKSETQQHPWMEFSGMYRDNPLFEEVLTEIDRYREQLDHEENQSSIQT